VQRAAHASVRALTVRLAGLSLVGSEVNAMANLAHGGTCTASQLAAAAGVPATTMTSVLDRLEHRGMIGRGSLPGDRRAVQVSLTTEGRDVAAAIAEAIAEIERRVMAGLSSDAIAGLRAGLDALAGAAP